MTHAPWQRTRLKYLVDVNAAVLPETTDDDFEFVYIDIGNVSQGSMAVEGKPLLKFADAPSRARRIANAGDSVVSTVRTYLRAVATVPPSVERLVFSTGFAVLSPLSTVHPRFLSWLLQGDEFIGRVVANSTGVSYPAITATDLVSLELHIPSLDEQRSIADHLDRETARIDTLIEEQQRLIVMLRERRGSAIASALNPATSWARRRIKHFAVTNLGKMLDAGRAVRAGDETRPYVRAADVRADGSVNLVDLNEMPFSDTEMATFDLRAGDVLLIEGGATVGRPAYLSSAAPGIAFQKTVNRLRVNQETDPRFVYWSLLRLYESSYYANHYGSVSFVHLTGEKLREIELELPDLQEQGRIASMLDEQTAKIDELILETERFIELSRERRAALITAAVTGQIDVREEAVA